MKVKAERDRIYSLPEMTEDDGMAVAELETDFASANAWGLGAKAPDG